MTLSTTSAQYGPSLRTRIVIISRRVRSRGVDELKMLLLMPQKFNNGLRGVDRGLPSVRSARGLQGRQELGRILVCVTDFVLRLAL